jgi:predicted AlkP superfamily pyrophosphatase or phosphodiesterase
MCDLIINEAQKDGKKFIYAYNDEPDHTMHETGPDSHIVKRLIQDRNYLIKRMCDSLKDALIIVVADHGHIKVDNIKLNDYPEIYNMLERTTSIEQRAVSFKIKDEFKSVFPSKFNELFGKWFKLYNKEEIIESKLFGDGDVNELFEDALGDYIAIAESSNKCILTKGDDELVSQHAGYTDDEIYVPLIIIEK